MPRKVTTPAMRELFRTLPLMCVVLLVPVLPFLLLGGVLRLWGLRTGTSVAAIGTGRLGRTAGAGSRAGQTLAPGVGRWSDIGDRFAIFLVQSGDCSPGFQSSGTYRCQSAAFSVRVAAPQPTFQSRWSTSNAHRVKPFGMSINRRLPNYRRQRARRRLLKRTPPQTVMPSVAR